MTTNCLTVETEDTFANLLDLAANDGVEGFKKLIDRDPSGIDEAGLWYSRQKGKKQMASHQRTPLMVAAAYGSINVLKLILMNREVDVNKMCGLDKSTALHCAASGGSVNAVDIVKLLLAAGADPSLVDANGHRPVDVIVVPPKFQEMKLSLEGLLATEYSIGGHNLMVSNMNAPPRSPSPDIGKQVDSSVSEKKEYPFDPSLPDIKNSIYSTDEFRMFSFKIQPCSRAYSHDWTECPFVHPGENARRRDPRKYHYSCVPCPDFRKGACQRGDVCEYAHGVFESWLHPAQYRTRLCKDGTKCNRRVCFFAHTQEELRPLYFSTGSAGLSPRANANPVEFAAAMGLLPGSPSTMSPVPFTPPMSSSANGGSNMGWPQQNVPPLHLPGSNLQSSRLRSSFSARHIPIEDLSLLPNFDGQQQHLMSPSSIHVNSLNRLARPNTFVPSNLDGIFSAESSSPRYSDQPFAQTVFSPTHKSMVLNQLQQQQQQQHTNFSSRNVDSPRYSPRPMEPISPRNTKLSILAQQEKHQHQFRSLSSRDLGPSAAAAVENWSNWGGSSVGNAEELVRLRRSSSFELLNNEEEPDLSWVQSLVRESPQEANTVAAATRTSVSNPQMEQVDQSSLGAWLEQMQLDRLLAQ